MQLLSGWITALLALSFVIQAISGVLSQRRKILKLEAKIEYLFQKTGLTFDPIPALSPKIRSLVADGQKIQAIKLYRELTGSSLREAKAGVEKIVEA